MRVFDYPEGDPRRTFASLMALWKTRNFKKLSVYLQESWVREMRDRGHDPRRAAEVLLGVYDVRYDADAVPEIVSIHDDLMGDVDPNVMVDVRVRGFVKSRVGDLAVEIVVRMIRELDGNPSPDGRWYFNPVSAVRFNAAIRKAAESRGAETSPA